MSTRTRGASELCRHLRSLQFAADERHFLIAHSHGGNVALYALKESDVASRVAGVVTMATPYLIARKRQWSDRISGGLTALLTAVIFMLLPMISRTVDRIRNGWIALLVLFALFALLIYGLHRVIRSWDAFADRVVDAMSHGPIARERLFIMRSPGDEASIVLLGAKTFLAIGTALVAMLAQLCSTLGRFLRRMRKQKVFGWSVSVSIVGAWIGLVWLTGSAVEINSMWAMPLLASCLILAVLILFPISAYALEPDLDLALMPWNWLLGAVLLLAMIVPSILMVLYGWQLALANIAVDVSAEPTPNGDWNVTMMASKLPFGDDAAMALTHSALYEDDAALEVICNWVESVLVAEAGQGTNPMNP